MLLRVDREYLLHRKECNDPQERSDQDCTCIAANGYYSVLAGKYLTSFEDRRLRISPREIVCLLKEENGLAYIVTNKGELGITPFNRWTKLKWRFNTVVIKEFKSWNGEDVFIATVLLGFISLFVMGMYCLVNAVVSSGKVDYCTIKVYTPPGSIDPPYYYIEGHRSWRHDDNLFFSKNREEADAKMKEICPK